MICIHWMAPGDILRMGDIFEDKEGNVPEWVFSLLDTFEARQGQPKDCKGVLIREVYRFPAKRRRG